MDRGAHRPPRARARPPRAGREADRPRARALPRVPLRARNTRGAAHAAATLRRCAHGAQVALRGGAASGESLPPRPSQPRKRGARRRRARRSASSRRRRSRRAAASTTPIASSPSISSTTRARRARRSPSPSWKRRAARTSSRSMPSPGRCRPTGGTPRPRAAIDRALAVGVRDAAMLHRAGVIAQRGGDRVAARRHFEASLEVNPRSEVAATVRRALAGAREPGPKRVAAVAR